MEDLKVGQVIISKQGANSENYQKFLKIVKDKKIKVVVVKKRRCSKCRKRFENSNSMAKNRTNTGEYIK